MLATLILVMVASVASDQLVITSVTASSELGASYPASNAVDGKVWTLFSTESEKQPSFPWLRVYFINGTAVEKVLVEKGNNQGGGNAVYTVSVIRSSGYGGSKEEEKVKCGAFSPGGGEYNMVMLHCNGTLGDGVMIESDGRALILYEIKVYNNQTQPYPSPSEFEIGQHRGGILPFFLRRK